MGDRRILLDQGQHADVFLFFAMEICLLVYDNSGHMSVVVVAEACRGEWDAMIEKKDALPAS